ncbi:MAG: putative toxin-antitoxin system toxin component, PIN family [bacterium]|nr:putative toxin-antitoxin system toxin component, PIN family [bacterium]
MNVVLDTNVVVSGTMTARGTCSRILDLLLEDIVVICVNDYILSEYETVLRRPELKIIPQDVEAVLNLIRSRADFVTALPLMTQLPDTDDLPFLEVAAAAEAVLVTGNMRHFPDHACTGVAVVSPAEFLKLICE